VNDYGASHDSETGEENNKSVGSKRKSTPVALQVTRHAIPGTAMTRTPPKDAQAHSSVECKGGDDEDLPQLDGIDDYNGRRPRPYDRPNDAGDTTTHGARASREDAQAHTAEREASDEDLPHFSHDIDDNSDYNGRRPLPHDRRDSGHETIRDQHEGDQGSNEGEDNGDGHHAENIDRCSLDRNSRRGREELEAEGDTGADADNARTAAPVDCSARPLRKVVKAGNNPLPEVRFAILASY